MKVNVITTKSGFRIKWPLNQGKHKKKGKDDKISHKLQSCTVSAEEISDVRTKITELYESNGSCGINEIWETFAEENRKLGMTRKKGRPIYIHGIPKLSRTKVHGIVRLLVYRKEVTEIVGEGQKKTQLIPLKVLDQLKRRSSGDWSELTHMAERVEGLKEKADQADKKNSNLTIADVHELVILEDEIMKFPIRIEQGLTDLKQMSFFAEAHRISNILIQDLWKIKNRYRKQYDSMLTLIKNSSLYCLERSAKYPTGNSIEARRIRFQKRTLSKSLGI